MYLILEYMKKGDMINVLKQREVITEEPTGTADTTPDKKGKAKVYNPLPDIDVWNIFRQTAAGLRYLHYQNVVHGDIKPQVEMLLSRFVICIGADDVVTPQNLLVGENGVVKIADFGISKMLDDTGDKLSEGAGTPAFMSPELCSGQSFSGQLADVWALGATMFMIKYGHPPFVANTVLALYHKIQTEVLTFPAGVPIDPGLKDLLTGMLEKDPTKRLTLQGVLHHQWMRLPPPPPMQSRLGGGAAAGGAAGFGTAASTAASSLVSTCAGGFGGGTSFVPPASYDSEQQAAMDCPIITAPDERDIFMSIGVRVKNPKRSSSMTGGALEEACSALQHDDSGFIDEEVEDVEDSDSDEDVESFGDESDGAADAAEDPFDAPSPKKAASSPSKAKKAEGNIMDTGWGGDVFEMVECDGLLGGGGLPAAPPALAADLLAFDGEMLSAGTFTGRMDREG